MIAISCPSCGGFYLEIERDPLASSEHRCQRCRDCGVVDAAWEDMSELIADAPDCQRNEYEQAALKLGYRQCDRCDGFDLKDAGRYDETFHTFYCSDCLPSRQRVRRAG